MNLRSAVADVIKWNKEMVINPCPSGGGLGEAIRNMESVAKKSPAEAWDIFRNGTDDEFSVLVNSIGDIGNEFQSDKANREVMRIAKRRGSILVISQTKAGFGALFGKFFNESEQPMTGSTHKFNELRAAQ